MQAIVTVDSSWGTGKKKKPLVSIPREMKSRYEEIAGHVVVYDWDYIPELLGKQPVTGCTNIIYTKGKNVSVKGATLCADIASLRSEIEKYDTNEVYIIHGEEIYKEFLKDFDVVHVTKIDYSYDCDEYFENLDLNPDFKIEAESEEQYCFDIVYFFIKYIRTNKA